MEVYRAAGGVPACAFAEILEIDLDDVEMMVNLGLELGDLSESERNQLESFVKSNGNLPIHSQAFGFAQLLMKVSQAYRGDKVHGSFFRQKNSEWQINPPKLRLLQNL